MGQLLVQTSTPYINLHLSLTIADFSQIPADTKSLHHLEMLTSHFIKDVQSVAKRFGAKQFRHKLLDHLPITDEDWQLVEWSMPQISAGNWSEPWVMTLEYGDVRPV